MKKHNPTDKQSKENGLSYFNQLFHQYFVPLVTYTHSIVNNREMAEDIVQEIFLSVWKHRDTIDFDLPIAPYLYKSAYNKAINQLNTLLYKKENRDNIPVDELINREIMLFHYDNPHDSLLLKEVMQEIDVCIDQFPDQRKKVFRRSRFQQMKNREIAEELEISEKAVEKHISKSLQDIRKHLKQLGLLPSWILPFLF